MSKLVLIRHGQSLWNLKNLFTGWVDVPLSEKGIQEAMEAGKKLSSLNFDYIYVSTLIRAMQTAMMIMAYNKSGKVPVLIKENPKTKEDKKISKWSKIYGEKAHANCIPVVQAWQLNERYYGQLQGMDKEETRKKFGEDQVKIWRRSFNTPPPKGEALMHTAKRTIPYFKKIIEPLLADGKNILVSAHGNSLRSIVMALDKLTNEEVLNLEIGTGIPILYEFRNNTFHKQKI